MKSNYQNAGDGQIVDTKAMNVSFKHVRENISPLVLNNTELESVKKYKQFGVPLTQNLCWSTHISDLLG